MEPCALCKRRKLVELVIDEGVGVAEAARETAMSREIAYKWLERFKTGGLEALNDVSRARIDPGRFDGPLAEKFVKLRLEHPTWGPKKLVDWFRKRTNASLPAPSTVGELLKRRGLVVERVRRPNHTPFCYAGPTPDEPCARWTVDFKGHFALLDGQRCHPLTLRDAASRKLLSIKALPSTIASPVHAIFLRCFQEHGLPDEVQSDGGSPFATKGLSSLSKLSVWLLKLDIVPVLSRPGKPQDNGAHERMHRDLKAETTRPPASTMRGQQQKFDRFVRIFNEERPHEALDGDVPDEHWHPSSRPFPTRIPPPQYPRWWEVRRVNPSSNTISWNSNTVKVNDALGGEDIAFEPFADGLYRVHFYNFRIGLFDVRRASPRFLSLEREAGALKKTAL